MIYNWEHHRLFKYQEMVRARHPLGGPSSGPHGDPRHHKGSSGRWSRWTPGVGGQGAGLCPDPPASPSATHFVVLFKNLPLSLKASQTPPFPLPPAPRPLPPTLCGTGAAACGSQRGSTFPSRQSITAEFGFFSFSGRACRPPCFPGTTSASGASSASASGW